MPQLSLTKQLMKPAVVVAALGYFVDIFDLILFQVVRKESLLALHVPLELHRDVGGSLMMAQMLGMLLGGILFGVLGDKRGRLSVLFGSIVLYSVANLLNGFVTSVEQYGWLRLIAGIGLAGELGAGITLVSELLDAHARGFATTFIASIGALGALFAVAISECCSWSTCYIVGGLLGFSLLFLRVSVVESGMFKDLVQSGISRGSFLMLFHPWHRFKKYIGIILVGIPVWYAVGILVSFSPELGHAFGMKVLPETKYAVFATYFGLAVGDIASGWVSQKLHSRKMTLLGYLLFGAVAMGMYFTLAATSVLWMYFVCFLLGVGTGYWALFVTVAAEQFGTNIRSTATTTVPNFVRGSFVAIELSYQALKPNFGIIGSSALVGVGCLFVAFLGLWIVDETFGKDLNFNEN